MVFQRTLFFLALFAAVACGSDRPDPPTEEAPVAEEPESAEEEQTDPETTYQNDSAQAPALDSPQAQRNALRRARAATQGERYDEALGLFDQLLHAAPRARRIWCEAGFVLHKSGNDERAARFLDHGLALYPRGSAEDAIKEPLAMCLYNRGLVHEARDEHGAARRRFEQSLALRPNGVVQSALEALHDGDLVTSRFFAAASPMAFRLALSQAYGGFNNFEAEPSVLPADVQLLGELEVGGVLTEVLSVWTHSYPLAEEYLVAAFAVEGGFRIVAFEVGTRDETDHGHEGESAISALGEPAVDRGLLHADVNILSSESYLEERNEGERFCYLTMKDPTIRRSYSLLCDASSFECALLPKAIEVIAPGQVDAEECAGMASVGALRANPSPSPWALGLTVESATHIRFARESGSGFNVPTDRSLVWRERSEILPVAF